MGTFFVLPVYLQVVLGFDAFETGKRLFPLSVALLIAALVGPRLAARLAPKRVCQAGLAALTVAAFVLVGTVDLELNETGFAICLAVFGVGAGLLLSQLGNVIMSSVEPSQTNEAGGLQGTAQNLGASLGTALIGAVLISGLIGGVTSRIENNPAISPEVRSAIMESVKTGIPVVPVDEIEQTALAAGVPADEAAALAEDYGDAQLEALKKSLLAVALLAAASVWFTRRLPGHATEPAEAPVPVPALD
jgi:MFS family permease